MIVKCIRRCWDGKKARRYYPGDQDDIDRSDPVAKYFDFPPVPDEDGPTRKQIMEELTAKGVEFDPRAKRDDLLVLLTGATR